MDDNRMRVCLLASIAVALGLALLGAMSPPLPALVGSVAALGLGMACGLWVAAFAVLSHGMILAEVVTMTRQSRKHGLIVVVA
jgi:hypothetical protein